MAQFLFHLEAILHHRKNQERQRQRDLAALQADLNLLDGELRQLNETSRMTLDDLRANRLIGKLDVQFLAAHRRYILSVQRKSMLIAQKMTLVQRQLDDARIKLMEAARQRKMMEKLQEKRREQWQVQQNHREFLEADDIGTRLASAHRLDVGEDAP